MRRLPKKSGVLTSCPVCGALYSPSEARILGERKEAHLVHFECGKCANSLLVSVTRTPHGLLSTGMVTDLSAPDTLRFKDAASVDPDDVIDIHERLRPPLQFISELKSTL